MKIKFIALIFLFAGCKSTKLITHPLLRTDGFYYRQKEGDLYHLVRFFPNGRLVVSRRACKPEAFALYPNTTMRNVDTLVSTMDVKKCSFRIRNDSVFFTKKPDQNYLEIYDVIYSFNLHGDSLTGSLQAINFDTTVFELYPYEKKDIKRKIETSFKFVKASYNKNKQYPKIPNCVYDLPKGAVNGKLNVEEL